jgi:competence protein ComEC
VLWPPPGRRFADPNDGAVVALARAGGVRALVTSDAESPVTLPLRPGRVDVLQVAHHGSADPGLDALLREVRPRLAVLSVGPNSYGHPHPDSVRSLRGAAARVRRTDRDGTVRITSTRTGPVVTTGR